MSGSPERTDCCICFGAVKICHRCTNGHPFCQKCISRWCLASYYQDQFDQFVARYSSPLEEIFGRVAAAAPVNTCPICRVVGRFRDDPETDSAQQVRCREVDAGDRRCRWTGRRDQLNQHQHVYDEPAGEQRQGAPAGRKRRAENHDQAPSAKAVRVDDGSRRTSSVPAGTARGRMNESPSVRGTAASVPEPRQPSTSDPRHIRDNDVHEQQQEEEEERDDVVDIVRDAVDAVADLIDDDEWDISVFADTATFRETFRAVADTAVAAGASLGDVGGFVLCSILLVADRIRRRRQ